MIQKIKKSSINSYAKNYNISKKPQTIWTYLSNLFIGFELKDSLGKKVRAYCMAGMTTGHQGIAVLDPGESYIFNIYFGNGAWVGFPNFKDSPAKVKMRVFFQNRLHEKIQNMGNRKIVMYNKLINSEYKDYTFSILTPYKAPKTHPKKNESKILRNPNLSGSDFPRKIKYFPKKTKKHSFSLK